MNVGMVRREDDRIVLTINIRYPVDTKYEDIEREIKNIIKEYEIDYKQITDMPPLYFEKDHFLIKTLLDVYKEFTGDEAQPIVIGGGTYARWAKMWLHLDLICQEMKRLRIKRMSISV